MAAGVGEDISVVTANFDAIAAILNGNIDNTNINAAAVIAASKLAPGLAGQVIGGTVPGYIFPSSYEYVYSDQQAPVNVPATTEAGATTIVTAAAITLDGATPVIIEFYSPYVSRGTSFIRFYLYDGAASIGFLGHMDAAAGVPIRIARRLTPSAVAHTYSIRASVDAGTGVVQGGTGGIGAYMPCFMRITKA